MEDLYRGWTGEMGVGVVRRREEKSDTTWREDQGDTWCDLCL